MAMERWKKGFIRLGDISLVAISLGCGYLGYQWNAKEDAEAREKRLRAHQSLARQRDIEDRFFKVAKHYDLKVDDLIKKRDQLHKLRKDTQTLSSKVNQDIKLVSLQMEKLQKVIEDKKELDRLIRQQRRTLVAEVQELSKLVKIKEDLQARSRLAQAALATADMEQVEMLSTQVQERNRVLRAEIEELMRLVKVKEDLVAKAEALGAHVVSQIEDPMLKKDDPVQS